MQALPGDNGPDQGQTLAAADRWRTDGTERELAMLIEVRGGASWRFSAPQSPIGLLSLPASAAVPRGAAAASPGSRPFDPACCASQLTVRVPARVRVVFADGAQVRARPEGRGRCCKIIAFSATILGYTRPGSSAPPDAAGRSNPACCVEW
jgi:hypothetical protein